MKPNQLDAFEQRLKESLEGFEVPYNSAHWAQMDRALSSGVKGWSHGKTLLTGALVAGALLLGGTAYYMGRDSSKLEMPTLQAATLVKASSDTAVLHNVPQSAEAVVSEMIAQPMQPKASTVALRTPAATLKSDSPEPTVSAPTPAPPAKANVLFLSSVKEACPGSPVDFTVQDLPEDGIFLWNFGDGNFSNKQAPEHTFTKPGSYKVMLSVSGTGTGSVQNKLSSGTITIHEAPLADFKVVKRDFAGQFPLVDFQSRAMGAVTYLWDFGDGSKSSEPNPEHVYKVKGRYNVLQTVTNATGCTDNKTEFVEINRDFTLGAPEQFSPNGDGQYDTFMPGSLKLLDTKFHLTVYNTEGARIYSTDNAAQPWTGKVNNQGADCAPGEYVWAVDIRTVGNAPETFTGKVKLVR
ncbi:MAG: PKD domain-containing protein [Flavobacteriales bacterium]